MTLYNTIVDIWGTIECRNYMTWLTLSEEAPKLDLVTFQRISTLMSIHDSEFPQFKPKATEDSWC